MRWNIKISDDAFKISGEIFMFFVSDEIRGTHKGCEFNDDIKLYKSSDFERFSLFLLFETWIICLWKYGTVGRIQSGNRTVAIHIVC